jgi:hypothetical protein
VPAAAGTTSGQPKPLPGHKNVWGFLGLPLESP